MNANAIIREQIHGCQFHRWYGDEAVRVWPHYGKCSTWLEGMSHITSHAKLTHNSNCLPKHFSGRTRIKWIAFEIVLVDSFNWIVIIFLSLSLCLVFSRRYDGVTDLSTAECYNPMTNTWQYITPMGTKRSCLGICSFDGLIYVGGGYDGASCLSSFERYDTLTGVWSSCPTMSTRRRYCRLAVVDNCIYALGGFDSSNYQASVEKFDPRVGRWLAVPSMTSRRSSCGVAALDGNLYCIGGNDGTMCMNSGERFNVRRNAWEPITAMHSRR